MTETMHEAAARLGVSVEITKDRGVQVEDDWGHHAYVLRVTFGNGKSWTGIPWRQGLGVKISPSEVPADILDSLVEDATTVDFETWCDEYGYDSGSRKAYATWETCGAYYATLRDILGADELEHLMYEVESL